MPLGAASNEVLAKHVSMLARVKRTSGRLTYRALIDGRRDGQGVQQAVHRAHSRDGSARGGPEELDEEQAKPEARDAADSIAMALTI